MKCPVCINNEHHLINLHSDQFSEGVYECSVCGTSWSVNHGLSEVIEDPNASSFLSATTEAVEGDDYCWAK